jgi:hypothetical protein
VSDYAPSYGRTKTMTFTAGATITGGQLVAMSAADTVSPTAVNPTNYIGIAGHDAATGAPVTVHMGAGVVHETAIATAATAAALLYPGAAGQVTVTQGTGYGAVPIGVAVRALGAAGTLRWKSLIG